MQSRKHSGFTLIELIVVIAIIGLLAGMLLTALSSARRSAQKTRAKSELSQIVAAWTAYLHEYKKFPDGINQMDADAARILSGENTEVNYREIIFMDFRHDLPDDYKFEDPWENVYRIALDTEGDNRVRVYNQEYLPLTVAAWSFGPDGRAETADDIKSWE